MSRERWIYPRGLIEPPAETTVASPLRLFDRGIWDPSEQYWGEIDDTIPVPLIEVAAAGPRPRYEFEQILPGGDDPDASDPILDAIGLRDRGARDRAVALLEGLAQWDPRCLDAHAHLGLLSFDDPLLAQGHYATGVAIAECSLPEEFSGVLGWGLVDNRPFLRCLHGLTLTSWRLDQLEEAEALCWALLWLNPADNQGARELLVEIAAGRSWHP